MRDDATRGGGARRVPASVAVLALLGVAGVVAGWQVGELQWGWENDHAVGGHAAVLALSLLALLTLALVARRLRGVRPPG